jgi:hypothetical protein
MQITYHEETSGMKRAIGLAGMAALALGMVTFTVERGIAADDKTDGVNLTADQYKKALDQASGLVKKGLGEKGKSAVAKARLGALLAAGYAAYSSGPEADRAATRDAAIKLADLVKSGKADDAKKLADSLEKPEMKGKAGKVAVLKEAKGGPADVMRAFSPEKIGGQGIEDHFRKLTAMKNKIADGELTDALALELDEAAVIFAMLRDAPGGKNPKDFATLAENSRDFAVKTSDAVKKKDGVLAASQLYKLTISCNKCHDKYKD